MFNVLWKEANIGELSDVSYDMWYIEGEWTTNDTELAIEFRMALQDYNPKKMLEVPHNAQKVVLYSSEDTNIRIYCLVMSLVGNRLSMRQVVAEAALDLFFPER